MSATTALATATAPRRIPASELLTAAELADVRERVEWKGMALIAHAWIVILAAMALVAWWPNPVTYVLAVMLIGSRQLGLAILMHDGAHRCFSRDEARNTALGQWLCAYPVFAETLAYRRYHFSHHAHTQTRDDPDLVLSVLMEEKPADLTAALMWATAANQARLYLLSGLASDVSEEMFTIRPGALRAINRRATSHDSTKGPEPTGSGPFAVPLTSRDLGRVVV